LGGSLHTCLIKDKTVLKKHCRIKSKQPDCFTNVIKLNKLVIRKIIFLISLFISTSLLSQQNIELLGNLPYANGLSDIWAYVDSSGTEYALVAVKGSPGGNNGGLSVVSIADPSDPVEVFFAAGTSSTWRDIKTYNGYAYVTTEAADGLMIVDLNGLPDTSSLTVNFYFDPLWITAHNLYIDENGIMYVFGAGNDSLGVDGVLFYDLNEDPLIPQFIGDYNVSYVHDGMARGDTLYTANVYAGTFSIVDVSDPTNPIYLGGAETPASFTHNIWVSDDGNYVFTTDEVSDAFIASYDISNLDDIEEQDRIQFDPGSMTIVHNVHFLNEYLITSYYMAGVTIHDVSDPSNMVQTGHYDTNPLSGSGFNGAWGVTPFLPSGLILVSDISQGLFVLEANYTRASRLEGKIRDGNNNNPIFNARVEILNSEYNSIDNSNVFGDYKTGIAEEGFFDVLVSKDGYLDVLVENVELINAEVTILDILMYPDISSSVLEEQLADLKLYPNPSSGFLTIDLPSNFELEPLDLKISDLAGRTVQEEVLTNRHNHISLDSKLEQGMYLLSLYASDRALYTAKIKLVK
jgi:choice-of-anchor B domain-containing protein